MSKVKNINIVFKDNKPNKYKNKILSPKKELSVIRRLYSKTFPNIKFRSKKMISQENKR